MGAWTWESEVDLTNGGSDDLTLVTLASGMPSDIFEVDIIMNGASLDADNTSFRIRLGDAGGIETTGYQGGGTAASTNIGATSSGINNCLASAQDSGDAQTGKYHLIRYRSNANKWLSMFSGLEDGTSGIRYTFSHITLDSALTSIVITTAAATAAFDGGSARVRYRA